MIANRELPTRLSQADAGYYHALLERHGSSRTRPEIVAACISRPPSTLICLSFLPLYWEPLLETFDEHSGSTSATNSFLYSKIESLPVRFIYLFLTKIFILWTKDIGTDCCITLDLCLDKKTNTLTHIFVRKLKRGYSFDLSCEVVSAHNVIDQIKSA